MTFGDHMRREAEYVLEDLVFQRSPTQTKLLRYLVERALGDGPAPTQYEIAVEALGKPHDFDLANDSYPRVQVSRLRNNLDNYYARTLPHDGHRLRIEQGSYAVRLVPYVRPAPPAPTGPPPETEARTVDGAQDTAPVPDTQARAPLRQRLFVVIPLAALALALAGLLVWRLQEQPEPPIADNTLEKPTVALRTDLVGLGPDGNADRETALLGVRLTEILLAYSQVSNTTPWSEDSPAEYTLTLSFVEERGGNLHAFLNFADADGKTLFNEFIEHDPDRPESFAREIRSALTHITSPTGEIAQDRQAAFGNSLDSGYACFITIENQRADGAEVADMVDTCITRHPQSEYVPFFRARRAFAAYRAARLAGEEIRAEGPAWRDLQLALKADPFNSFANIVAGKVLIAQGDCEAARANLRIAFEQAANYPVLRAAVDAETTGCPAYRDEIGLSQEELRAMIGADPAPDALYHFYMLVAALASNDLRSARMLASRPQKPAAEGRELETVEMLHRALADPAYARAHAARLRAKIAANVWGEKAVDLAMANLLNAASSRAKGEAESQRSASLASGPVT